MPEYFPQGLGLTYNVRAENIENAANVTANEPLRFYTTTTNTYDWTPDRDYYKLATMNDLEELKKAIYKLLTEHTNIDISEDEFMNILNNG